MDRPTISTYRDLASYMADMLAFRKHHERHFSVLRATKELRRVSPALVSLMLKGQRKITLDRADELAKLLALTPHEKQYFKDWIARNNGEQSAQPAPSLGEQHSTVRRKATSSHILSDWINVYVKDAFQLRRIKQNPKAVYAALAGIASQKRIDKAINFLLRAGYLRKDLGGKIVEDTPLHVVDQRIPDQKVREFHKGAIKTALHALDQYPAQQRYANALLVPLDKDGYQELTHLIDEIAEKLQKFAETRKDGDGLYQVIINLSPTGGFRE